MGQFTVKHTVDTSISRDWQEVPGISDGWKKVSDNPGGSISKNWEKIDPPGQQGGFADAAKKAARSDGASARPATPPRRPGCAKPA